MRALSTCLSRSHRPPSPTRSSRSRRPTGSPPPPNLERQREVIEAYLEEITFAPMRLNVLQATTPGGTGGAAAGRATPSTRTQREQNTEPTAIASVPGTAPAPGTQQSVTPYSAEVTGAAPAQPTNTTSPAGAPQTAVSPAAQPSTPTTTAVPAEAPPPAPNRGFSVKNTLSPEEFRRLMAHMNGAPAPTSAPTRGRGGHPNISHADR